MARLRELDGVRGVAILLVVAGHANPDLLPYGGPGGVTLFFVLSGYLITGIIAREVEATGRLDLRAFWARRARRIVPAVALLSAFLLLAFTITGNAKQGAGTVGLIPIMDYWVASNGFPTVMAHAWSLAVEEQFYILWPLILVVLARVGRLRSGLVVIVATMVAWRVALDAVGAHRWAYYSLDGNAYALALGGLAAVVVWRPGRWWAAAGLAVIVTMAGPWWAADVVQQAAPLLAVAGAVVILGARFLPWLAWRPLSGAGRVSYGWYLWHYPAVLLAQASLIGRWSAVLLALGVATLSWRYVERPFLQGARSSPATAASPARVRVADPTT